jgi:hypothetical protein
VPAGSPAAPAGDRAGPAGSQAEPTEIRTAANRNRTGSARTARLFSDVPTEETDVGWGERPDQSDEDRLLADRPPHHLP